MRSIKLMILGLAALGVLSPKCFSGNEGSGGGIVVECNNPWWNVNQAFKQPTIRLVDTANLITGGKLEDFKYVSQDAIEEAMIENLNQLQEGLGSKVKERLQSLLFLPLKKRLKLLNDDQYIAPAGCRKRQLAIQDFESGIVKYDLDLFNRLSYQEQAYFRIHEAVVSLEKKIYNSTLPIRAKVNSAAEAMTVGQVNKEIDSSLKCEELHQIEVSYQAYVPNKIYNDYFWNLAASKTGSTYPEYIYAEAFSQIKKFSESNPSVMIEKFLKTTSNDVPLLIRSKSFPCAGQTVAITDMVSEDRYKASGTKTINVYGRFVTLSVARGLLNAYNPLMAPYPLISAKMDGNLCFSKLVTSNDEFYIDLDRCKI
ncbi:MAG: hypothetical protein AB7I27_12750 [Bacteriovoracaceae bacterium]